MPENKEFEEWKKTNGYYICRTFDIITEDLSIRSQNIVKNKLQNVFEAGQQSERGRWIPMRPKDRQHCRIISCGLKRVTHLRLTNRFRLNSGKR